MSEEFIGTPGPDSGLDGLLGTAGDDTILGLTGADQILGLGGADSIDGGPDGDEIIAGDGDDTVFSGDDGSSDDIDGGVGDDLVIFDGVLSFNVDAEFTDILLGEPAFGAPGGGPDAPAILTSTPGPEFAVDAGTAEDDILNVESIQFGNVTIDLTSSDEQLFLSSSEVTLTAVIPDTPADPTAVGAPETGGVDDFPSLFLGTDGIATDDAVGIDVLSFDADGPDDDLIIPDDSGAGLLASESGDFSIVAINGEDLEDLLGEGDAADDQVELSSGSLLDFDEDTDVDSDDFDGFSFIPDSSFGLTLNETADETITVTLSDGTNSFDVTVNLVTDFTEFANSDLAAGGGDEDGELDPTESGDPSDPDVVGSDGADFISGNALSNALFGGEGDDSIFAGGAEEGADFVAGGEDDDIIGVSGGNDVVFGDDVFLLGDALDDPGIVSGEGDDTIFGGAGNDLIWAGSADSGLIAALGAAVGDPAPTFLDSLDEDDSLLDELVENLFGGFVFDSETSFSPLTDFFDGDDAFDLTDDDAGIEQFDDGSNVVFSGTGIDIVVGEDGDDVIGGGAHDDLITGADGDDTIFGGAGAEGGDDLIGGGDGDDEIFGGAGDDIIGGGEDADLLFGGDGDDQVFGGSDGDTIFGGAGDDLLSGSGITGFVIEGDADGDLESLLLTSTDFSVATEPPLLDDDATDVFAFIDGHGDDTILGFQINDDGDADDSDDLIDLSGVTGLDSFDELDLDDTTIDGEASVVIDTGVGSSITLVGVDEAALSADDFIF